MAGSAGTMQNELVRYSRAGDTFHYRWAARRCLRLVQPKSRLKRITIEGSVEQDIAGEYVIDVAEYSRGNDPDQEQVVYFQLKHTTTRTDAPFTLSGLKDTFIGFAKRFAAIENNKERPGLPTTVQFAVVTNRPISESLRDGIAAISEGRNVSKIFQRTLEKYTRLLGDKLERFCSLLTLVDGQGNYAGQWYDLHVEISELVAGTAESTLVDSIVSLVQEKALPRSDGTIVREDVLKRFGVTSDKELFPAPAEFDTNPRYIVREQHEDLINEIIKSNTPVIIHASGGVGKTVVARQLASSFPVGSVGVVYDCFGAGNYRTRSASRHRHSTALVQIANEIASCGLCDPMIPNPHNTDEAFMRAFLARLGTASTLIRHTYPNAILAIFIDAADNAEMAAREFAEPSFAHQLLRERLPDGCRLVELCRTERINLLKPPATTLQLELRTFSEPETTALLRESFPDATSADGREFFRLTGGNPRVQANALSKKEGVVAEVLASLGPKLTTVDEQIEAQLRSAISNVKDKLAHDYQDQVDAICLGLANLPPLIPIDVLADAADVTVDTVRSFVSDIGRPLWLSDSAVQFRDEPTETWFRKTYSGTAGQLKVFIARLKPLAAEHSYVAEALPSLLLQAGEYDQLIALALSDNLLPQNSPVDARNVRVYRLQFAFKAALKQERYADAAKLAFRAGEEVAGDDRQFQLFGANVDLVAPLQSEQRVQELAFRRRLRGAWDGSENVYAASLLSSVSNFKGEARGYLRAAESWLKVYFNERDKKGKRDIYNESLQEIDIVELAQAHFNLFGPEGLAKFTLSWRPPALIFEIARPFVRRLIDSTDFASIESICGYVSRNIYFVLAIASELLSVGRFPPKDTLDQALMIMAHRRSRVPKRSRTWSHQLGVAEQAIVPFAEACAAQGLPYQRILRVLRTYFSDTASLSASSDFQIPERDLFLRQITLRAVLTGAPEPSLDELMPSQLLDKEKSYNVRGEVSQFKEVIGGLLPWYILRARILTGTADDLDLEVGEAEDRSRRARAQRWRQHDPIPSEIARVRFGCLLLDNALNDSGANQLVSEIQTKVDSLILSDRIAALRATCRLERLATLRDQLEHSCIETISSSGKDGPEEKADWYIQLARAVLPLSRADASAYFDLAVEAVSKFGDEVVERWEAVVDMAKRTLDGGRSSAETTYRFIRCAELVGDSVAREKYFNRNEAVRVAARLHPPSAFSALSRWRDRDVGWLDRQLPVLATEAVKSQILPPAVVWSLSSFRFEFGFDDFLILCVEKESDPERRQRILDEGLSDLRLSNASTKSYRKVKQAVHGIPVSPETLSLLELYCKEDSSSVAESSPETSELPSDRTELDGDKIADMLQGLDLASSEGLDEAKRRFAASPTPRVWDTFWKDVLTRIPPGKASMLLQSLAIAENVDLHDVTSVLHSLPQHWRNKASIKRIWSDILAALSRRFAYELTNRYMFDRFLRDIGDEVKRKSLQASVILGLAASSDLASASHFFGTVRHLSSLITPDEAVLVLDYALSRFEEHLDDDYADGPWGTWMVPPEDVSDAFAGFLWATLGSPHAAKRWCAAHSVRRLAGVGRVKELDALIEWMSRDSVGAFGSHKYPFYNLHARLYLFIALARVAFDQPDLIRKHHAVFAHHALSGLPHVLLQKFSAETALSIGSSYPHTFDTSTVDRLRQVGTSQLPEKEIDRSRDILDSPWHVQGEIDLSLDLSFAHDFDRYWFEPLGRVFGTSSKQVEELAREIVLKEWQVTTEDKYFRDPRAPLWRSSRTGRETWHSHGEYPRIDDYAFYFSYHALMSVAARLLQVMPVIRMKDWDSERWSDWLLRHYLTRSDGRWLADRRDPAPLTRRSWISGKNNGDWSQDYQLTDFLDGLVAQGRSETWLNVFGHWTDHDGDREESYEITSALVAPEPSQSLLNALTTCHDPYDYRLPEYQESDVEFDEPPFVMEGWIFGHYIDKQLDSYDPHAAGIEYPPYSVGDSIMSNLQLVVDLEKRRWRRQNANEASLVCTIWSEAEPRSYDRDRPVRGGKILSASLRILMQLCSTTGCELILKVRIERRRGPAYQKSDQDDAQSRRPVHKVYILSADGTLRDTESRYQLREGPC